MLHELLESFPGEGHHRDADIGRRLIAKAGKSKAARRVQAKIAHMGQTIIATPGGDLSRVIDAIRAAHGERCLAMEMRKRIDLMLGSYLRSMLGWRPDLPDAERSSIRAMASDLIKCGEKVDAGKKHDLSGTLEFSMHADMIIAAIHSRGPWEAIEDRAKETMEVIAAQLPVWHSFGADVRGFGPCSLAVIVGEAGDLSLYATKSKLWKRMGVAVFDGVRQGGLPKNASADEWIAHGYNRERRSKLWNIGDSLIKSNGDGIYRQCYLDRKEYERKRAEATGLTVAPSAKIPKKRAHEFMSDGHIHRRAQRYMEKRLLRDLWQAWRRSMSTTAEMPN